MGQTLILNTLGLLIDSNIENWQRMMGANLVNNNWFFLRYAIQLALISNAIQLLDIPHNFIKSIKYICHKRK